jgi:hypothetical protein
LGGGHGDCGGNGRKMPLIPKLYPTDHFKYQVMPGDGHYRFFKDVASARKFAQAKANDTGRASVIRAHHGKGKWTVKPKTANPHLPRGKWIKAKIRVTKSGKIQAKLAGRSR